MKFWMNGMNMGKTEEFGDYQEPSNVKSNWLKNFNKNAPPASLTTSKALTDKNA